MSNEKTIIIGVDELLTLLGQHIHLGARREKIEEELRSERYRPVDVCAVPGQHLGPSEAQWLHELIVDAREIRAKRPHVKPGEWTSIVDRLAQGLTAGAYAYVPPPDVRSRLEQVERHVEGLREREGKHKHVCGCEMDTGKRFDNVERRLGRLERRLQRMAAAAGE